MSQTWFCWPFTSLDLKWLFPETTYWLWCIYLPNLEDTCHVTSEDKQVSDLPTPTVHQTLHDLYSLRVLRKLPSRGLGHPNAGMVWFPYFSRQKTWTDNDYCSLRGKTKPMASSKITAPARARKSHPAVPTSTLFKVSVGKLCFLQILVLEIMFVCLYASRKEREASQAGPQIRSKKEDQGYMSPWLLNACSE